MVMVAVRALADDAQQLLLQAGQLGGDCRQLRERQLADLRIAERHRLATVLAAADGVQPEQLAWQVEAEHVLLARGIHHHRLEAAFAGHEYRPQRIASAIQAFALGQRFAALHHRVQPDQVFRIHARRQAQHLQRAFGAAASQPC